MSSVALLFVWQALEIQYANNNENRYNMEKILFGIRKKI
jgi:hypothetical protein